MTTKFLFSATSKERADYAQVHGNLSADGFRCHRDNSLPPVEDYFTQRINESGIIPTQPRNRATVSRVDLLTACKRAYAFMDGEDRKIKDYPVITFCMNGSLIYSAKSTNGTTRGEIIDGLKVTDKVKAVKNGLKYDSHTMVFKHHNPEKVVSFGLNSSYLLEALQGLEGNTVEIDIPSPRAPFYITDGTREAVIMPVNIGI